ncbi:hypothetical protein DFH08DRAFT_795668 [Mycena albidolilacea]|uniref:Uncharacterized protein n=1 Tax=Mycena albidolilacea TaxID=1033008 RepID=A0AAD7AT25_9AGAR|nr:hypothetical protein DFH08DRAFT_795668 [Mycena albidolilacea]
MMRAGKGKASSGPSTLIVDDWRNKETAEKKLEATSLSSCDEAFWEDRWLLILHPSQTAWYATQQNDIDTKTKRKLYWTYIVAHPAHAEISMAQWMGEAHRQALLYLKWCSFEALTSSTAKTPFPLKHSNDLANLLTSLDEESVGAEGLADDARESGKVLPVDTQAGSSQEQDSRLGAPDGQQVETAAQERYKLRTSLIAKVLTEKYSQLGAIDALNEANQPPKASKAIDVLFWIVDVASVGSFLRYLHRLDEIRDTLLTDDKWRDHIWRLVKEWEEFNLISTVLLSASAGILSLDNIGGIPRTAILISILGSFGGITTGLYCITMYQPRAPNSREAIDRTNALTMFKYNQYTLTHKGIAMVLGLPMAFLVWSLVAFMVGILSFNIVATETSGHVSGVAYAVVSVAAAIFLLIALAFYSLARLWGSEQGRTLLENIREQYLKVVRHWRPLPETKSAA